MSLVAVDCVGISARRLGNGDGAEILTIKSVRWMRIVAGHYELFQQIKKLDVRSTVKGIMCFY